MRHEKAVFFVAFGPDGRTILTGSQDQTARLWDADTGRPIGQPMVHRETLTSLAFSPDGTTVLTGSQDRMARLWDAATGRPIGQAMEHSGAVNAVAFSPDGKTILTGSEDRTARQWDAASGRPIGQAMEHSGAVRSVAFSPDGQTIVTAVFNVLEASLRQEAHAWDAATGQPIGPPMLHYSRTMMSARIRFSPDGRYLLMSDIHTARLWDAPAPLPGDPPRLAAWVEAATGLELDDRDSIHLLDGDAWRDRRRRLERLGGPPPDPAPRRDPILYGAQPTARGDALAARGLWDQAEAAYAEAAQARPLNAAFLASSVWGSLTRLHLSRGHPERAVSALGAAVSRWPDSLGLRGWQCRALLAAGDRIGWEQAIASLLDRSQGLTAPDDRHTVAWLCSLGPYAVADRELPIRLAEAALRDATEAYKPYYLNTLGIALYRAGRFDEAIRRMEEAIRAQGGGEGSPFDWPLLAMAHHRLGHRDLARRWLERLADYRPSEGASKSANELDLGLLRNEAEALIRYDPVFPDDPFAH
jgi:tetratricopeptide (TPR) repeat protein